ncbi:exonuclease SbcCD subunit D [Bacillus sp. N9]
MKFIHTADWHLGKLVHGIYMTKHQRLILDQFIQLVAEEKPDAVIIAGDLYDRSVPPTEAVTLLEEVLYQLNIELETPVIAIAGNHDSAQRLSFGSSWYKHRHLHIQGSIENCFEPVRLHGVNFYSIPYVEPGIVREWFDDQTITSHDAAMRRIIGEIEQNLRPDEPNVFVGHAFVLGGKTSDSERTLSVGGSGCVSADCFAPFAYTALGHLHSPDAIRHETIRYSGSLMKYSFSEVNHRKSVSIVTMNENGSYEIEEKYLQPEQDMREVTGFMDELLDPAFYEQQKTDDFLKITLLDEGAILDPVGKLRQVYPNVLHLERKIDQIDLRNMQTLELTERKHQSELDLFSQFYHEMTTREFTEKKRNLMAEMIEHAKKR